MSEAVTPSECTLLFPTPHALSRAFRSRKENLMPRESREFNARESRLRDLIIDQLRRLLDELRRFEAENAEEFNAFAEAQIGNPVTDLRQVLVSLLESFEQFIKYRNSERALQTLLNLSLASGQTESVLPQLESLSASANTTGFVRSAAASLANKVAGWFGYLKNAIQSISTKLWSLISSYVNLKEWSIKGAVTTPTLVNLFGFTASAELQLTFEK
jgi:hypothetical protein